MHNNKKFMVLVFALTINVFVNAQCFISSFGSLGQLSKTTGNYALDSKFNYTKTDLESAFGVRVDLYVYNDGNSPNAFARQSNNYLYDGLVAFGRNMLVSSLWRMDKGEYAVAGVMAHEFAHVLQLKKGCYLPGPQKEMHADYMAGYFFGKRNYLSYGLRNFAVSLFEIGDYDFWSPEHHGTPTERVNAMLAGYNAAYKGVNEAYQAGIAYVRGESTENSGGYSGGNSRGSHSGGSTYVECSKCDGTGEIETTRTCSYCGGRGVRVCSACRGNGGFYNYGYNAYGQYGNWWFICRSCGGNKGSFCNSCAGKGTVIATRKCYSCNGTGKRLRD